MFESKKSHFGIAIVIALALGYGSWQLYLTLGGLINVPPKDPFVEFSCKEKTFQECSDQYHKKVEEIFMAGISRMKEVKEDGQPKKGKFFDPVTEPTCRQYVQNKESANPSCVALTLTDLYQMYAREVYRCYRGEILTYESYKCDIPSEENKRPVDEFFALQELNQEFDDQIEIELELAKDSLDTALVLYEERYRDYAFHVDQLRIIDASKKYFEQIKKTTPWTQKLPCKYNLATSRTCKL